MSGDLGPLDEAPRAIRPPFDRYAPDDRAHGETSEGWRARRRADRQAALRTALAGIKLGAHDQRMIEHFAGMDDGDLGTLVSWLLRVRAAGRHDG
mgnify:CR=1 FL=1